MRFLSTLFFCLCIICAVSAQKGKVKKSNKNSLSKTEVESILTDAVNLLEKDTSERLVSVHAFRALVKNDFSKITKDNENDFAFGKYASIKINQDDAKVKLTPITWIISSEPNGMGRLHSILAVNISASLDSEGFFNFASSNKIKAGVSYTNIFKIKYRFRRGTGENEDKVYKTLYHNIKNDYFTSLKFDRTDTLKGKDEKALKNEFYDKVAEEENIYFETNWTKKIIGWTKTNLNIASFDNFNFVYNSSLDNVSEPIKKTIWTPSLNITGNLYTWMKKNHELFVSGTAGISLKHSLSEVSSTTEWNQIRVLSDSTYLVEDSKKVFMHSSNSIKERFVWDAGAQLIWLFKICKIDFGVEGSCYYQQLISNTSTATDAHLIKPFVGVLFFLKDKKGKSTVVIEPFYQYKHFINHVEESAHKWGIKFSLPFGRL